MIRIFMKCAKCGREQYIDMHKGTEAVQVQVEEALTEGSAEEVGFVCPCGGRMVIAGEKELSEAQECAGEDEAEDELVPIDEWNGECWKTLFDWLAKEIPEADPWDSLAAFIKVALIDNN